MTRENGKFRTRLRKAILSLLFPTRLRETRCDECGRPFLEYPERNPTRRFEHGKVDLLMYHDKSAFKESIKLRVGVWKSSDDNFYFGQLFGREDLISLSHVVSMALGQIEGCEEVFEKDVVRKVSFSRH